MEEQYIACLMLITLLSVAFFLSYYSNKETAKSSYLKGQSDCLQGKVNVTLVEFEDGERKWYYTNELKDLKEYIIVEQK